MKFDKLKTTLLSLSLILGLSLQAQLQPASGDVYIGPEIKSPRRGTLEDIIGKDKEGYYMVRAEPSRFYLEKYDLELNLLRSEEIDLGRGIDRKSLEFAEQLDGEIYLFTSQRDPSVKDKILYVDKIDRSTLKPEALPIQLVAYNYRNRSNDGLFDYHVSRDSTKLMVYYDTPYQANTGEKFGITVFDDQLNMIWTKQLELPFKDRLYDVERYKVDNEGNAYLLGIVYKGQVRTKRQGRPNYDYHLLVYDQGEQYEEYLLNLKDKFITDMQFEVSSSGDIVCAGFYSELGTTSIKGTFYLLIDPKSKEIIKEYYQEFEPDFLADFMTERKADKGRELFQYDLNRLEIRRDGGVVLIAEQYYAKELQDYNNYYPYNYGFYPTRFGLVRFPYRRYGYGYPYYDNNVEIQYNYNDIMVVNLDPDGSVQWAKRIPKRQRSKNDGGRFSSYALSVAKGKMFFVYNDNPKNLHKSSDDLKIHNFTKGKESVVVLATLNANGELKKEPLFQVRDTNTFTKPKVCEQISRDQMIIYSQRNKKAKFAKLTFK